MSRLSRSKGSRAQTSAGNLLRERDYTVQLTGLPYRAGADLLAFRDGAEYAVEVKDCVSIDVRAFRKQAMRQAGSRLWMVMCHVDGTSSWLVLRQAERPAVWHARASDEEEG